MTELITWQKSSYTGADDNPNCVQLAAVNGQIRVRESDAPGFVLTTDRAPLRALLATVKAGTCDHLI
ncbi:DUF397 domain-containing protein [Streptomyces sp. JV176]|uniref:DUF397 domain-containing protein n=1 Tax=Streptomyces sp. JV176 TaxID=858630 RepID=UPI002E77B188|nr:DUF397 domain-containing protein [Streptomyces sp. JV176]MEE1799966.1 DUF397 domain-containing protein [Streptomyces sp. JV176]